MQAGARIEVGESKETPDGLRPVESRQARRTFLGQPLGQGPPGLAHRVLGHEPGQLGEQIDIHGGGNDLIFPHHENEIAQTESYTGKQFARYWVHNGMLQLGGEKMSKSLGNLVTIKDFLTRP